MLLKNVSQLNLESKCNMLLHEWSTISKWRIVLFQMNQREKFMQSGKSFLSKLAFNALEQSANEAKYEGELNWLMGYRDI